LITADELKKGIAYRLFKCIISKYTQSDKKNRRKPLSRQTAPPTILKPITTEIKVIYVMEVDSWSMKGFGFGSVEPSDRHCQTRVVDN
jgi:hypothetical protein